MFFDPTQKNAPAPSPSPGPAPPPGNLDGRTVVQCEGQQPPRTSAPTLPHLTVTPLADRTIAMAAPTAREAVNARLAPLIGKIVEDPSLAKRCAQYFELNHQNRIIGAREDVNPAAAELNPLIVEVGRHIASRNDIGKATSAPSPSGDVATQEQARALIGKTIEPGIAEKYAQKYPETYNVGGKDLKIFDGTGRITEAIQFAPLERADVEEMAASETAPLTQANSKYPRDAPRIETEIIFEAIVELRNSGNADLQKEATGLSTAWLSGTISKPGLLIERLRDIATKAEEIRAKTNDAQQTTALTAVGRLLGKLAEEVALMGERRSFLASKGWTNYSQYHDNVIGRRFETELVKALVDDPPPTVLAASAAFGGQLADFVDALAFEQPKIYTELARILKPIATPYAAKLAHLQDFLDTPSSNAFRRMATTNNDGYDILKQSFVCGRLSNAWEGLTEKNLAFANRGANFAVKVLEASRHSTPSVSSGVMFVPRTLAVLQRVAGSDDNRLLDAYNAAASEIEGHIGNLRDLLAERAAIDSSARSAMGHADAKIKACQRKILNEIREFRDLLPKLVEGQNFNQEVDDCYYEVDAIYRYLSTSFSADPFAIPDPYAISFSTRPPPPLGDKKRASARQAEKTLDQYRQHARSPFAHKTEVDVADSMKKKVSGFADNQRKATAGPGFGTALPHQPKEDPGWDAWPLHPYKRHADVVDPSPFERNAFDANRYIGRGASGSTIMMFNAFREFEEGGKYEVGDAMMGTIMFMTFDSGHSISDSLGALNAYQAFEGANGDFGKGREALNNFSLDYSEMNMGSLKSSDSARQAVSARIDVAMNRTLQWFESVHHRFEQAEGTPAQSETQQ